MQISRRGFTGGALSLVLGSQVVPAFAQARVDLAPALAAIRAFGEAHLRYFGLPGMTLGLTTPDGFSTVMNFGFADRDTRRAIAPDTLFQIGSITKLMTAALLHQFAGEGRLRLTDRVSTLLPVMPLPPGNTIEVQHLIDHVAGLPGDAPPFPDGGLWTAYPPGRHWHYSNTAYDFLGKLAEHVGGKPLDQLFAERLFLPLAMKRSRGAIIGADRALYAQGYEALDQAAPFARGEPLAPAPWVDVTTGAGSVGSTADDMIRFLRSLANAAQGRGGLGLGPEQGKIFTSHSVPSDAPGMRYGNGLMHVGNAGRSYLHHTGGMISFSSSFHVDTASGVGAFASSTLSAFAEYRPRTLTRFAVDALTTSLSGRPAPSLPPFETPLANSVAYAGRYSGPGGAFEVRSGVLFANGRQAALQPMGDDLFRTLHPDFHAFSLMFERKAGAIVGASWGPQSFLKEGGNGELPASNAALAKFAGRFVNDSPWYPPAMVVERGGKLWIGTETPMTLICDNLWRVGEEDWSPERARFADFLDGRPETVIFSGEAYLRHDI